MVLVRDWCEVRNGANDGCRDKIADTGGTDRQRVLLSNLHQHDAPVAGTADQQYLHLVSMDGKHQD